MTPSITEKDFIPEHYEMNWVDKIGSLLDPVIIVNRTDRYFINGLMRKMKPKKVLEVGVAGGGCSALMLHALSDREDTRLYSVDLATKTTHSKNVGWVVPEFFPQYQDRWTLRTGLTAAQCMEEFGAGFDFCYLDAAHMMPGEIWDFLAILPYLNSGAVVAMHDICDHVQYLSRNSFATALLLSVVHEAKVEPRTYELGFCNIGAFQLAKAGTDQSYVDDLLRVLTLPWKTLPSEAEFNAMEQIFKKYYRPDQADRLRKIYTQKLGDVHYLGLMIDNCIALLNKERKTVLYGPGNIGRLCLKLLRLKGIEVDCFVCSETPSLREVDGVAVRSLDELVERNEEVNILITASYVNQMVDKLRSIGWEHSIKGVLNIYQ